MVVLMFESQVLTGENIFLKVGQRNDPLVSLPDEQESLQILIFIKEK